jgi:alpha-tubulin suppressor-like RCC1 family protein
VVNATALPAAASRITPTSGNNQQDTVRAVLKDTIGVRVEDQFGNPVPGVAVTFTVTSGAGSITALNASTDSLGRAKARWSLGPTKGTQTMTATVSGLPAVTFTANALGAPAATVVLVSGNSQSALVGNAVPNNLVVRVEDAYGNVVANAPVTWGTPDGGIITPTSLTTDPNGLASATWQLALTPGPQTATVRAGNVTVNFNATATLIYRTMDAADFDACGITPSAQAFCFGYNGDGQLGVGSTSNRNSPTAVQGGLTFRQISGGRYHTCGITLAGIAWCWGNNQDKRLGVASPLLSTTPVQVSTVMSFASIASGRVHTCGLGLSGLVACWGFNGEGEIGAFYGPADSQTVGAPPRYVSNQVFKALTVGGLHSCAIDIGDQLWCWGHNNYGQLGDGTTNTTKNNTFIIDAAGARIDFGGRPVAVISPAGVTGWKSVTAGYRHTCAIATNNNTYCWGDNTSGQLGNGFTRPDNFPTPLPQLVIAPGGALFTRVASGLSHTCAITAAGSPFCWGENNGKFGNNATTNSNVPVAAANGLTLNYISAGETVSCGVTPANIAYCWGDNTYGQLGDATNTAKLVPTKVAFQP